MNFQLVLIDDKVISPLIPIGHHVFILMLYSRGGNPNAPFANRSYLWFPNLHHASIKSNQDVVFKIFLGVFYHLTEAEFSRK